MEGHTLSGGETGSGTTGKGASHEESFSTSANKRKADNTHKPAHQLGGAEIDKGNFIFNLEHLENIKLKK